MYFINRGRKQVNLEKINTYCIKIVTELDLYILCFLGIVGASFYSSIFSERNALYFWVGIQRTKFHVKMLRGVTGSFSYIFFTRKIFIIDSSYLNFFASQRLNLQVSLWMHDLCICCSSYYIGSPFSYIFFHQHQIHDFVVCHE